MPFGSIYEQISILEKVKNISVKKEQRFSIEEIHQMTSASKSCWSDTIIEERAERV